MKRKILLIPLALLLAISLVAVGCAKPAPAPAPAPEVEVITWKVQDPFPATGVTHLVSAAICDAVTKSSDGRLVFKSFSGGAIVPAAKEIDAVDIGAIDATFTCTMYNLDKWPAAGLFSARPGGLTPEAASIWFQSYGIDFINTMVGDYNILALKGILPQSPEIFLHSEKKIETVAELKGLKVRTSGDGGEVLTRMGASVVFMPGGEVYESMQRGVIDAFEYSSPSLDWSLSFQEVAKYVIFSATRAPSDPKVFYVSRSRWNELPPDLQMIVEHVLQSVTREWEAKLEVDDITATKKFADYGCVLYHLPADVEEAFMGEAKDFYDERSEELGGFYKEVLQSQRAFRDAYNQQASLNNPLAR